MQASVWHHRVKYLYKQRKIQHKLERFKQSVVTRNSFHGGCHWGLGMVGAFLTSEEFLVPPPSMSD